jgi:hypothetical protein
MTGSDGSKWHTMGKIVGYCTAFNLTIDQKKNSIIIRDYRNRIIINYNHDVAEKRPDAEGGKG